MTHKLIYTPDYLLVVDNSEIKKSDFCYDLDGSPGYKNNKFIVQCLRTAIDSYWNKNCKKIIAHLPLNNSLILTGVTLLPPLEQEDDVEKIANKLTQHLTFPAERREGIILGYNKTKEKYKYTEEDMIKAIITTRQRTEIVGSVDVEAIIKSLSQPKMPIAVKCEIEQLGSQAEGYYEVPITTTNSQGKIVWVGKYIY